MEYYENRITWLQFQRSIPENDLTLQRLKQILQLTGENGWKVEMDDIDTSEDDDGIEFHVCWKDVVKISLSKNWMWVCPKLDANDIFELPEKFDQGVQFLVASLAKTYSMNDSDP